MKVPFKELLLYVALAVCCGWLPSLQGHPLVGIGLLWILCLAVIGRLIQANTAGKEACLRIGDKTGRDKNEYFAAIVIATYGALVLLMWGPFALSSGMGYETGFSFTSEINTWLSGFVGGDPMRPFTNVFYHTAYLLGVVCGIPGSFVPFQFVYAMLWLGRGILTVLVLRRLMPGYDFLWYMIGAFVMVHASDGALQWVGQMNQFGYIFWLLLGAYMLLRAVDAATPLATYTWTILACHSEGLCLWSYESGLPILALVPAMILLARRHGGTKRVFSSCAAWYSVIALYICLSVQKYLHDGSSTYQASVMRTDWRISSLFSDFLFNVKSSLFFWSWPELIAPDLSRTAIVLIASAAVTVFILGGIFLATRGQQSDPPLGPDRMLAVLLACGMTLLIASFPAYLLLSSARMLWRTQFLSGLGSAIVVGSAIALIVNRVGVRSVWFRRFAYVASLCLASFLIYDGARRALELGSFHRTIWERHRRVMAQVIRVAPQIRPGTVFVLCGIPRDVDPFGDSVWFDMALRLAYPGTKVGGSYYYDDGAPAPGAIYRLHAGTWISNDVGFQPLIEHAPAGDALVLRYEARTSRIRILTSIPAFLCQGPCAAANYHPENLITSMKASPRAINRYGPL